MMMTFVLKSEYKKRLWMWRSSSQMIFSFPKLSRGKKLGWMMSWCCWCCCCCCCCRQWAKNYFFGGVLLSKAISQLPWQLSLTDNQKQGTNVYKGAASLTFHQIQERRKKVSKIVSCQISFKNIRSELHTVWLNFWLSFWWHTVWYCSFQLVSFT